MEVDTPCISRRTTIITSSRSSTSISLGTGIGAFSFLLDVLGASWGFIDASSGRLLGAFAASLRRLVSVLVVSPAFVP